MIIDNNKVVSVDYELTIDDNGVDTLVEKTSAEDPFEFIFGIGGLLEDFENNLKGLSTGDTFDFVIAADRGYGRRNEENVVHLDIEVFKGEDGEIDYEMLEEGNILPMMDNDGNRMQGTVVSILDDVVVMDFNHPLAEKALHFSGKVLGIREATSEELNHGHVHGPHGHHH